MDFKRYSWLLLWMFILVLWVEREREGERGMLGLWEITFERYAVEKGAKRGGECL